MGLVLWTCSTGLRIRYQQLPGFQTKLICHFLDFGKHGSGCRMLIETGISVLILATHATCFNFGETWILLIVLWWRRTSNTWRNEAVRFQCVQFGCGFRMSVTQSRTFCMVVQGDIRSLHFGGTWNRRLHFDEHWKRSL